MEYLFRPGERIRLRIINGSAQTFFNVRIPGLPLNVVATDGQPVRPVEVDELQIGTAETYDVIIEPGAASAYSIVAGIHAARSRHGVGDACDARRARERLCRHYERRLF